ncbi:MAG: phenylalanine--tRNA ligase subunit beta, partial [Oscillospiraceae bacterium]|nr:phenylalanine--tRNA ligase subunit beta [Oscillospiraceae bacterium]
MKISLNWIKDYVEIPETIDLTSLAYDLTMSTVEVEGVTDLSKKFDNIVVGEIIEVLPHPNADKLRICRTLLGEEEKRIVCGGINVREGLKVAVACPGAKVRWHGEGDLVEIGLSKIRGEESYGMICASSEIGLAELFPSEKEAEITELPEDLKSGTPLAQALSLNDIILEIDNKSLTNRPDLWGHYGIAREIAALYNLPLKSIETVNFENIPAMELNIEDTQRCRRYSCWKMEGLSVKPAPYEMQVRIWSVGLRPINALVDITNYVMLATGQPTHAFDADNISGHITVRRAQENEKLLLLNGKELALNTDDLVIADNESAVGLAGVMGGSKDSVLPTTDKVILEIANFEPKGIRRTATRYETRTEAASRYEKAIDTQRCDDAVSLSLSLFKSIYPEMNISGHCEVYAEKTAVKEVEVSLDYLNRRLGKEIPVEDIKDKLNRLGFTVEIDKDILKVTAPSWRSTGDISISADIMEEVARMYGFENFEPTTITTSFMGAINQTDIDIERKIKEYLAFRCGLTEIFTYPWMTDEYINAVLKTADNAVMLSTPPAPDEKFIRSSLLPNLCKAVSENLRYYNEFSVFESANIFNNSEYVSAYDEREKLPLEKKSFAGAVVGSYAEIDTLFCKTKGIIEYLPKYAQCVSFTFDKVNKPIWADETVWLNILCNDKVIGNIALLSKKVSLDCGIKNSAVMVFEFDFESIIPYPSRTNTFEHLAEYPMVNYDVSMLFDTNVTWNEIFKAAFGKGADDLLKNVSFVDEYKGKQVPEGKKSVTIRLTVGSSTKTLTSEEIENKANAVMKRLKKTL